MNAVWNTDSILWRHGQWEESHQTKDRYIQVSWIAQPLYHIALIWYCLYRHPIRRHPGKNKRRKQEKKKEKEKEEEEEQKKRKGQSKRNRKKEKKRNRPAFGEHSLESDHRLQKRKNKKRKKETDQPSESIVLRVSTACCVGVRVVLPGTGGGKKKGKKTDQHPRWVTGDRGRK